MPNCLTVWHKDEVWHIVPVGSDANVKLLHYNYYTDADGKRTQTKGFHLQNKSCENCRIIYAFNTIMNHNTNPTNKNGAVSNEEIMVSEPAAVIREADLWDSIMSFMKRLFRRQD